MMSEPVRIELDEMSVCVGSNVRGKVLFNSDDASASVAIALVWRTIGEFDPEEKEVSRRDVVVINGRASFSFAIPSAGPMSYSGQTFSIEWAIRADAEPPVETPLSVAPSTA